MSTEVKRSAASHDGDKYPGHGPYDKNVCRGDSEADAIDYNGPIMTDDLADRHCKPCEGGVEPLRREQAELLMQGLDQGWVLRDDSLEISRRFSFPAYSRTLGFANAVAWIAITEGHHPELVVNYGTCDVKWSTHAVNGLSDNDFICAAKVDRLITDTE